MSSLRKNVASQHISFVLVNASTGAALTGATFTSKAWVAKDGSQAGFGGTFTELGNGQYDYAPTQAETNCASFGLAVNPTSSIPINLQLFTDNWDTSQPVVTSGTGTDQLSVASGKVDAGKINGVSTSSVTTVSANVGTTQPINFTGTAGSALVKSDMVDIAGAAVSASTAQIGVNVVNIGGSASAGAAGYVGLDWGHITAPTTTVNLSGTTIATVTGQLTAAAIATGVWQDTTAGDFTVASSIGKSLFTSGVVPGGSGGLMISGANSGTTTLGALTITGAMSINGTGNVAQTGDSFARIGAAGVSLTAVSMSAAGNNAAADALLDRADAIETGITPRLAWRYTGSAIGGVLAGAATTTVTIQGLGVPATNRITATVDANGNRSAVTLA